jgi:hypothetical protein
LVCCRYEAPAAPAAAYDRSALVNLRRQVQDLQVMKDVSAVTGDRAERSDFLERESTFMAGVRRSLGGEELAGGDGV